MTDITELDYSPLPPELEIKIIEHVNKQRAALGHGEGPGVSYGQSELAAGVEMLQQFYEGKTIGANETFKLPPEIVDEILTHIPVTVNQPYDNVKAQIATTNVIPPHIDFQRKSTLYYLMSQTGPTTSYYDGPEKPDYIIAYLPTSLSNKRDYVMERHHWYSFTNDKIHEVTGITGDRLSVVVDLSA